MEKKRKGSDKHFNSTAGATFTAKHHYKLAS